MSFIAAAAIAGGATLAAGYMGAQAAGKAAKVQASAANRAADLQQQQFERQVELQEPWRQAGITALNKLIPLSDYTPFGMDQFQQDPGYAFRLAEGQKALERSAAARGGLLSGAAMKGATRFGQEMGSQEYTNAFNRYQTERAARLQPLQSLAGVGQTTAQQIGEAGARTASITGDLMTSGAAARATGYMGGANALSNALGQGMNFYQNQQRNAIFQNMMNPPSAGGSSGYSYTPTASYDWSPNYTLGTGG
jgi:hypothetical protein